MGSLGRKLRRKNALKKKKALEKGLKTVTEKVESMPKICGVCSADFDKTDKEMINQWRIAVYEDGRFHLTCPNCGPTQEEIDNSEKENFNPGDT